MVSSTKHCNKYLRIQRNRCRPHTTPYDIIFWGCKVPFDIIFTRDRKNLYRFQTIKTMQSFQSRLLISQYWSFLSRLYPGLLTNNEIIWLDPTKSMSKFVFVIVCWIPHHLISFHVKTCKIQTCTRAMPR